MSKWTKTRREIFKERKRNSGIEPPFTGEPGQRFGTPKYRFVQEIPLDHLDNFQDHRRLGVFFHKGCKCAHPECDRVGTRLIFGMDGGGGIHLDVYTEDLHLMTVDHIHPLSKGGRDTLENKQPMCHRHNSKKGNKVPHGIISLP